MLQITVAEGRTQRRWVVEGQLINSWASELRTACDRARSDLHDRELVIDLNNLTAISQVGENPLIELMNEGVRFRPKGAFTKHVLAQLASRAKKG